VDAREVLENDNALLEHRVLFHVRSHLALQLAHLERDRGRSEQRASGEQKYVEKKKGILRGPRVVEIKADSPPTSRCGRQRLTQHTNVEATNLRVRDALPNLLPQTVLQDVLVFLLNPHDALDFLKLELLLELVLQPVEELVWGQAPVRVQVVVAVFRHFGVILFPFGASLCTLRATLFLLKVLLLKHTKLLHRRLHVCVCARLSACLCVYASVCEEC
jgi:hypothetical protein